MPSIVVVEITRVDVVNSTERKNVLKKKTATDKTKPANYGGGTEVIYDEEYEIVDASVSTRTETLLLKQVLPAEDVSLSDVISAVNKLGTSIGPKQAK